MEKVGPLQSIWNVPAENLTVDLGALVTERVREGRVGDEAEELPVLCTSTTAL